MKLVVYASCVYVYDLEVLSKWHRRVNDQEHMYGMTTDETQPKEVFREVEKFINLDGIKTPTTPSES